MSTLVGQVARLHQEGRDVLLVTSGAIAAGRQELGITDGMRDIPCRQAMAAVGQTALMQSYQQLFEWHGIKVAQALLTRTDLADRLGYLNARRTLLTLLELRVLPVINENDVVAVEELGGASFGDNDNLSGLVANLVDADLLVLLSDVDGLYTADPGKDKGAKLIPRVERIDRSIEKLASGAKGRGLGGMKTKLEAAKLATASGATAVIAGGFDKDVILRVVAGDAVGTIFMPTASKMESRKRWILSGLATKGSIVVDAGAVKALKEQNRSLLPAGVKEVEGKFERGDAVNIMAEVAKAKATKGKKGGKGGAEYERIGCGITNYSSKELAAIKGARSDKIEELLGYMYGDEVVHRNDLVVS
jgi:glutamate 5-kinase